MDSDLQTVISAVNGEKIVGSATSRFSGVSIDTRTLKAGELFVCIQGDRFDGHDFLNEAIAKKPAGVIVSDRARLPLDKMQEGPFAVAVPDTLKALQDLAAHHRNQQDVRVVGVTGTNGKSTTKEMIAAITGTRFKTLKTQGNLNNHIGVPLTLLNLTREHEVAVIEMGMSAAGEIRRLAEIAKPEIGVITNVSEAHMVQLKTIRDVQAAKGELFEALSENGTAIVNADDPLVLELADGLRARAITFGLDPSADVQARDIRAADVTRIEFTARVFDTTAPVRLPFSGMHNVRNALAALATGAALGMKVEGMVPGLEVTQGLNQRGQVFEFNGMTILNDTYNANPRSMREAIHTLTALSCSGRRFLVMGAMLELGEQENIAHRKVGEWAVESGIDYLVTVGMLAGLATDAAAERGMDANRIHRGETHDDAAHFLKQHARAGDCLLFKGSRGSQMETVIERFTGTAR
ncbi:UDP-N-acetylmuramoyl-tripeptide--D-alanyl-D-alanine ligase [Nitrospina gracilis 3/211]|uniref:UDP-N-acetylmuramoyl-tripeptide--D-alanyl-D-alanine ligase n=1 Tax=Nitrospina gracilis (strain 3/211) TaxID=1266370 RepID=M1YUV6_NITG3|nr:MULTISPECIES: UDP-N-acetylmuramoyl-tripeptide--D-alanyl-D-alanine ligase [Nitrospina]MCF8722181.1 UDP-N-acetylmuramoyl-tripeptide--D-alanyl-D-alanine ligase [Nitrospina sp. Nb-3]CCQ89374.1 UDP-N-acetylmuramoyl-tripeptide--D-alanyl-D-alanine ligase [Nitrospina gracilis 3/211]